MITLQRGGRYQTRKRQHADILLWQNYGVFYQNLRILAAEINAEDLAAFQKFEPQLCQMRDSMGSVVCLKVHDFSPRVNARSHGRSSLLEGS